MGLHSSGPPVSPSLPSPPLLLSSSPPLSPLSLLPLPFLPPRSSLSLFYLLPLFSLLSSNLTEFHYRGEGEERNGTKCKSNCNKKTTIKSIPKFHSFSFYFFYFILFYFPFREYNIP
jgi:hypothetical protein